MKIIRNPCGGTLLNRGLKMTILQITWVKNYGVGESKTSITPHKSSLYLCSTHQNGAYNMPDLTICVLVSKITN